MASVFVLSDHTGLTAEAMARALLAQFPGTDPGLRLRPFLDDEKKLAAVAEEIAAEPDCLVFSSLADPRARALIHQRCPGRFFDFFQSWTPRLAELLGRPPQPVTGSLHGTSAGGRYQARIRALEYSMMHDDGAVIRDYEAADVILVGVSRSGKTPTCLYLALHHGLKAANYPLVEEDLEDTRLPAPLVPHRERLVGLTIDPEQLQRIRARRRNSDRYAGAEQCRREVRQAEALFRRHAIPVIDTTAVSVEEIATRIKEMLPARREAPP